MTNSLTNADRCPVCNGMLALIGRVHRCVPVSRDGPKVDRVQLRANIPEPSNAGIAPGSRELKPKYLHRASADEWRSYMRGYMKRRRAKA